MREQDTAQVALRIGRGRDGRGALVAIHTSAYPDWLPVANRENPCEVRKWSSGERAIAQATREQATAEGTDGGRFVFRTDDIRESVHDLLDSNGKTLTDRGLRKGLNKLADRGVLRKEPDPEDGRRNVWVDTGLSSYSDDRAASVALPAVDRDTVGGGTEQTLIDPLLGKVPYFADGDDSDGSFNGPLVADRETVVNEVLGGVPLDPPAG